jgi:hypothetical protein
MNRRITLTVGSACAVLGLCLALAVVGSVLAQSTSTVPPVVEQAVVPHDLNDLTHDVAVGRYQGVVDGSSLCLFDTATGEVWHSQMQKTKAKWILIVAPVEQ